jgi:hypothetical protein
MLVALVAALLPAGEAAAQARSANAVVALIDTGINPYHVTFRDNSPRAQRHPSTYIPGFPRNARALRLSLDEPDYLRAVLKDCERVWSKVEPGKLYWFPGTKIIGGITFQEQMSEECQGGGAASGKILDFNGHGTMVASRAASKEYGACRECLIVAVQGFSAETVEWTADHARWIDAQSNSWGPILPLWQPTDANPLLLASNPRFVRAVEEAAQKHLAFWATGNGVLTRGGVLGHPTVVDPRMTPSIVMVGGHDSGYINLWPGFPPHVVSDSCNSWAAYHNDTRRSQDNVGSGTSAASPFAAGGAARILLEARRILGDTSTGVRNGLVARGRRGAVSSGPLAGGRLTLEEWKEISFKTASDRPERQEEDGSVCGPVEGLVLYSSTPVQWKDVPDGYPEYLHIGYGAVDRPALRTAFRVLRGREEMPDRTDTDRYFELDAQAREALHRVYSGG